MNKYSRVIIILIVLLTIYSMFVFGISSQKKSENKNEEATETNKETPNDKEETDKKENDNIIGDYNIIISPNTILSYKNQKWYENKGLDFKGMLFDVYVDNISIGKKYVTYNDEWNIYDENKNFYDYDGDIFAVNTSKDYALKDFIYNDFDETDAQIISGFLSDRGITYDYEDMNKYKIIYDINRDGIRDDIYYISNAFTENQDSYNKSFSFGFVNFSYNKSVFYEYVSEIDSNYSICNPYLQNIIEINNNLYLITGCTYFSDKGTQHYIYEFSDNTLKEVLKTSVNNN